MHGVDLSCGFLLGVLVSVSTMLVILPNHYDHYKVIEECPGNTSIQKVFGDREATFCLFKGEEKLACYGNIDRALNQCRSGKIEFQ